MTTKAGIIMPQCELEAEFFDTPCATQISTQGGVL